MTIYLDVVFLENLIMNYIILFTTGIIQKKQMKQLTIFLASTLGSVYAILAYINILPAYSNLFLKILLSIVMVYIAFKPPNFKALAKMLLFFYLISFALGGCAFFLLYFLKPQDILMRNGVLIGSYPIKIALLGGVVGFIVVNIAFKIVKTKFSKKDMFCEITIYFENKIAQVRAILDTGNMLKEPISKTPVIVVESKKLEEMLPKEIVNNIDKILKGENIETLDPMYLSKFRVIPFTSLGKQNGMLLGLRVEQIEIKTEESIVKVKDIIIGIYDKKLSTNNTYEALIGLELLENNKEKNNYLSQK